MESAQKNYFTEYARESGPIFPIDLSIADFSKKIAISDDTMVRRIKKDTLIMAPLQSLRYSNKRDQSVDLLSGVPCIPIEAQLFLECLYKQTANQKGKLSFGPFAEALSEEELGRFMNELFQTLCKKVMENPFNEQADCIFTRHILFQSEKFRKAIFDKMWEDILKIRVAALIQNIREAPSTAQIEYTLVNCLASLDHIILDLQSLHTSSSAQKAVEWKSVLKRLMHKLISERKNIATANDRNAVYQIYDSKVSEDFSMRQAFQQLKSTSLPQKDNLRQQTTARYLKDLTCEITDRKDTDDKIQLALDFEQFYIDMKAYLDITDFSINDEKTKSVILTYCKQFCLQTLQRCTFTPGKTSYQDIGTYKSDLIANFVALHMEQTLLGLQEIVHMTTYYNVAIYTSNSIWAFQTPFLYNVDKNLYQHSKSINEIAALIPGIPPQYPLETNLSRTIYAGKISVCNSDENIYYLFARDFFVHFSKMWTILYGKADPIINKDTYQFNDLQVVLKRIWEGTQEAIKFFEGVTDDQKIIAPFTSRKHVRNVLRRYRRIIQNPTISYHPSFFLESVPLIMQSLLIMVLQKVATNEALRLVEYIKPLASILQNVKSTPL